MSMATLYRLLHPTGDYKVVTLKTLQQRALADGEIFRINTGQGLPAGTDAVVMVEDTELLESSDGEEVCASGACPG